MSQPSFGKPDKKNGAAEVTEVFPAFDHGYFDALVAIGFAALADAYHETVDSPLIERRATGFAVTYKAVKRRTPPDLSWLRYSTAKEWPNEEWFVKERTKAKDAPYIEDAVFVKEVKSEKEEGDEETKYEQETRESAVDAEGKLLDLQEGEKWNVKPGRFALVNTEGSEVSLSEEEEWVSVPDTGRFRNPRRELYATINSLRTSNAPWFNLCIYLCRKRGKDLIENKDLIASDEAGEEVSLEKGIFKDDYVTLNSTVLPQASKGANSTWVFSITNSSLSDSLAKQLSRKNCLAVAGLLYAAVGHYHLPTKGFAIPVPQRLRLEEVRWIARQNRQRSVPNGFFFQFDNYLNLIEQLMLYKQRKKIAADYTLFSVAGANFIELGEQGKPPQGSWQLTIPNHECRTDSVECLRKVLKYWREEKTSRLGREASVDRAAVRQLVRGFEQSSPLDAAEGYLKYIADVGLRRKESNRVVRFTRLTHSFFKEIMSHNKYSDLLQECRSAEVRKFINLVRQDTHNAVYHGPGEPDRTPNYEMMRRLREVQDEEDFIGAITAIAVERGMTKLATARSEDSEAKFFSRPFEPSIEALVRLAEKYEPRLIAQLILSLALCERPSDNGTDGGSDEE